MRLRIVTYNIRKGVGTDLRRRLDRIAMVLQRYEPDVVALQEVFRFHPGEDRRAQPDELAETLGMAHVATGWNVTRRLGVYGNATLSRLPLDEPENICLRWGIKKRRSALYTRVRLPGGPLHLFNVHLGLSHFERKRQMRRVAEHSASVARPEDPVLIVGDTNDWRNRLYRQTLSRDGFSCASELAAGGPERTFPSFCPIGALDRVYVRGDLRVVDAYPSRVSLARVASDHLPVIADLEFHP